MITSFDIYLIGISSNISHLFIGLGIVGLFTSALAYFILILEELTQYYYRALFIPIVAIICLTIGTLIPSSKVLASMIIVPSIVNNEQVQVISKNGLTILEELSKQWVKEIIEEKEIIVTKSKKKD